MTGASRLLANALPKSASLLASLPGGPQNGTELVPLFNLRTIRAIAMDPSQWKCPSAPANRRLVLPRKIGNRPLTNHFHSGDSFFGWFVGESEEAAPPTSGVSLFAVSTGVCDPAMVYRVSAFTGDACQPGALMPATTLSRQTTAIRRIPIRLDLHGQGSIDAAFRADQRS